MAFLARIGAEALVLNWNDELIENRVLADSDVDAIRELNLRYQGISRSPDPEALKRVGEELFRWLDGEKQSLSGLMQRHRAEEWTFELRHNGDMDATSWTILNAPWEVLADEKGFLAADSAMKFRPFRRIGSPMENGALNKYRLGIVFMAAAPDGVGTLQYEREESEFIQAVGEKRIDLKVEETGTLDELCEVIPEVESPQVLHISCHGTAGSSDAQSCGSLLLEDAYGGKRYVDADELLREMGDNMPPFMFVSACESSRSAQGAGAHSICSRLAHGGQPAAVGWDGSVYDTAATTFSGHLYRALSTRQSLETAVAQARAAILNSEDASVTPHWHMARLWFGPKGGGKLVAGTKRRPAFSPSALHGQKEFLDKKGQRVPVAPHHMFVGRRKKIQECLRSLRNGENAAVMIQGRGRLGKSSLAARVVNRMGGSLHPVIIYDDTPAGYSALSILQAIKDALIDPQVSQIVEKYSQSVQEDPGQLQYALAEILRGPCNGAVHDGDTPILMVIDDLEKLLDEAEGPDAKGKYRFKTSETRETMQAVLKAFSRCDSESRLLLTTRFPFALNGMEENISVVQLSSFKKEAQEKLYHVQRAYALESNERMDESEKKERDELLKQSLALSMGNPGLQNLLGERLAASPEMPVERVEEVFSEIREHLEGEGTQLSEEVAEFIKNLALERLLGEAGESGKALLQLFTVFTIPVPERFVRRVAEDVGGSVEKLKNLGLWDIHPDVFDNSTLALQVPPMLLSLLPEPDLNTLKRVFRDHLDYLLLLWGGEDRSKTPPVTDVQLTRFGLLVEHVDVVECCATYAISAASRSDYRGASRLGEETVDLLGKKGRQVNVDILSKTAEAAFGCGSDRTEELFNSLHNELEAKWESTDKSFVGAFLRLGDWLIEKGKLDQAKKCYEKVAHEKDFADERECAIAYGKIGDILFARGDLDEALRIRREEQLPAFERLGDVRELAVTHGKIGDILFARGDLDEALRIRREEELPVYERLGDVKSIAVTHGQIGDILFARGDLDEALRSLQEDVLPAFERLGDVRSIAVTHGKIGDILFARGDLDEALRIRREEQLPVYERLGDVRSIAVTHGKIGDILFARGDLEEALRICREEQLPAFERLGDVRELAVTHGKIGDILFARGDLDEALRIRREELLPVYERLGDVRELSACYWKIAQIFIAKEDFQQAAEYVPKAYALVDNCQNAQGIAIIGIVHGQFAFAAGHQRDGMNIIMRSLELFEKMGDAGSAENARELLNQMEQLAKDLDQPDE